MSQPEKDVEETVVADENLIEEVLEKRIEELERKLYGLNGRPSEASLPENSILSSIERINTFMSTALSGREKLNMLIERLPELENLVASDYEPPDIDIEKKLEYIITMEPQIRENVQLIDKLQELTPLLESDRFNNLDEMVEKLHSLSLKSVELGEKANEIDEETKGLVDRYNQIIQNISKTLIAMDEEVTVLKKKAEPQKVVD